MSFEGRVTAAVAQPTKLLGNPAAWLIPALLVLAAIVQQSIIGLDTDVSWLLTVGEKMLDGQQLYVDIFEVNPPASVLIYLPGIIVARAFGLPVELVTTSLIFLLAGGSIWLSARLALASNLIRDHRVPLLTVAAFALLLLPGACFGQREHVAVLTLLPFIAVLSARMKGSPVGLSAALAAGLGAGVTVAIKPHFAMAVAPMLILLMVRRRSVLAGMQPETWAAATVVVAYAFALFVFFPGYVTDALPLLKTVYLPARGSFAEVWLSPAGLIFFVSCGMAVILERSRILRGRSLLLWVAALGFAAAMGVQGKGYLNHCYPLVALAILGLGLVLAEQRGDRAERIVGRSVLLILAGSAAFVFAQAQTYPELASLVRRVAPPHPRIIVAGSNLSIGHPLTRWVGGEWVGRRGALWATGAAVALMDQSSDEQKAVLKAYIDDDRRTFVEDIERGRPDAILVPGDIGRQWIAANPDVARATAVYRPAGTAQGVTVMVRATPDNRG